MAGDDGASAAPAAYANPLPPPSHPAPKQGGAGPVPATPMTNSDFRNLLNEKRVPGGARGSNASGGRGGRGGGGRGDGEFKCPTSKPKPKPKKPEADVPDLPSYRDRAKERREEAAPEFQGDQSGAVLAGVRSGVPGVTHNDELRQLSIEESKFLGGDVEHTHLVKGLDFALLRKVRTELRETTGKEKTNVTRAETEKPPAFSKPNKDVKPKTGTTAAVFKTAIGRAVRDAVLSERKTASGVGADTKIDDRFASSRVSFLFNLDLSAPDAPTTTVRSASDGDTVRNGVSSTGTGTDRVCAGRDTETLAKVATAIASAVAGGAAVCGKQTGDPARARKKAARVLAAAAAAAAAAALEPKPRDGDSDEDIFGDAGRSYDASVAGGDLETHTTKSAQPTTKAVSYFGDGNSAKGEASAAPKTRSNVKATTGDDDDAMDNEADRLNQTVPPPPKTKTPLDAASVRSELERRAELSLRADDGYGECYAGGAAGQGAFYASDDDEVEERDAKKKQEDTDTVDAKNDKEKRGPKGASGAGGAKQKRDRDDDEAHREKKLELELGKLQGVMREKYGDKMDVAFGDKGDGEDKAETGGGDGGDDGGAKTARGARKRVRL